MDELQPITEREVVLMNWILQRAAAVHTMAATPETDPAAVRNMARELMVSIAESCLLYLGVPDEDMMPAEVGVEHPWVSFTERMLAPDAEYESLRATIRNARHTARAIWEASGVGPLPQDLFEDD